MTKGIIDPARRIFLKATAMAGGGLAIGIYLPLDAAPIEADDHIYSPNAWIRITRDDSISILIAKSEMGQGVATSLAMIVAEELDADWTTIRFEFAPTAKVYAEPERGAQFTGNSRSVRKSWMQLREAGATARALLIAAAAQTWEVEDSECIAQSGHVFHKPSDQRLSYGSLAKLAASLPLPEKAPLKDPKNFTIIGKSLARLDTPAKVNGSAEFGLDIQRPGMRVAVLLTCPVYGGKPKAFDATVAKQIPGVRQVIQIDDGIAVVADNFWAAKRGRDALQVSWDNGALAGFDSAAMWKSFAEAAQQPGLVAHRQGHPEDLQAVKKQLNATYSLPLLAHAPMEPMNCTVELGAGRCDIWVGTQTQTLVQNTAAKLTGLPAESVYVHTTFLGGGFGRRLEIDFVVQALQIAKIIGAPVKLIWTREDDMQRGYYRPASYHRLSAGFDRHRRLTNWTHRIVSPSIFARIGANRMNKNGTDPGIVGGADSIPYAIANIQVDWVRSEFGIPVARWRSVEYSHNTFVIESFIDEAAAAVGIDPYQFRLQLLKDAPRLKAVLDLAVQKAGWHKKPPKGRHRGLAIAECYGSYVAEIAEVSVSPRGAVRVHRIDAVIDCGTVINPSIVVAQVESAIVYGLTATLKNAITLRDGRIEQSNFHDYPVLRMDEMPEVRVHIIPSTAAPGGVGEPGTPPIAPAVTNAIFKATGKRVRQLPVRPADLV